MNVAQNALVTGEEPPRYGNAHPSIVPYQPFAAGDGWIAVAANDGLFEQLCHALGRAELAADARFLTNAARVRNRDELLPLLEETFLTRTADEWVTTLDATGGAGREDPGRPRGTARSRTGHDARGSPTAGSLELVAPPFALESAAVRTVGPPPLLGQHTWEVLAELGVNEERVAALEERGVVATAET